MKTKILIAIGGFLLLAGGILADRFSTICPIHHVQATGTGRVKDNGMTCEYSHYVEGTGATHAFWAKCD